MSNPPRTKKEWEEYYKSRTGSTPPRKEKRVHFIVDIYYRYPTTLNERIDNIAKAIEGISDTHDVEVPQELMSDIEEQPVEDLSLGIDVRGDQALFVETTHISGYQFDAYATNQARFVANMHHSDTLFFRVIQNGIQTSSHGWVNAKGEVVQWG